MKNTYLSYLFEGLRSSRAAALFAFALSLGLACGPNVYQSSTSQGCCFYGPTCECDGEEHEFLTWGTQSITYIDPCNPENNIADWDPLPESTRTVTVPPWTTMCGINYFAQSIQYFMTYSTGCAQCGYDQRIRNQFEDCSG